MSKSKNVVSKFGVWLRDERKRLGFSRRRLGKIAQVDGVTIGNIEDGKCSPQMSTRQALRNAVDLIIRDRPPPPPPLPTPRPPERVAKVIKLVPDQRGTVETSDLKECIEQLTLAVRALAELARRG